jgi:glucokinase
LRSAVLGIDLGGTSIKGALVDGEYSVLASVLDATPQGAPPGGLIDAVVEVAGALVAQASSRGIEVAALTVATAGVVDEQAGIVRWAGNLAWRDTPVAPLVEERTGIPATLLNDARAAARAEGLLGAARGAHDFIMVTLGTGIGGAVVVDGQPVRGAHGLAGEIGHLRVVADGCRCGCGGRGCLETIASARAVAERYNWLWGSSEEVGAETVVERALTGDARAAGVWREAVDALATALAAIVAVVDCELIVVGGGMALAGRALLDPLEAALGERITLARPPRLALAQLGDRAGALGAAVAAWNRVFARPGAGAGPARGASGR